MTTKADIITLLKDPVKTKVVLVEVLNVKTDTNTTESFYLSSKPFYDASAISKSYNAIIIGGVSFNESISLDGGASIGFGDIELDNTEGAYDIWLNYIWTNKTINIYIGEASWLPANFYQIFTGTVDSLLARTQNTLNIVIADKSKLLDFPVTEIKLGGTTNNKDRIIPLTFGECFNVSPLLADSTNSTYQVHGGAIQAIIEIRDNGATPISATNTLSSGTFQLEHNPFGNITCSVQGSKLSGTYSNTIPSIIKYLIQNYGKKLTGATFTTAFDNFSSYAVGLYIDSNTSVAEACKQLADSAGGALTTNSSGQYNLVKLDVPASGATPDVVLTDDDIVEGSFQIKEVCQVKGSVKLGYCKNWSPQTDGLAAGINPSSIDFFKQEWRTVTATDSTAIADRGLTSEPEQEDTLLINNSDATTEVTRRKNLWSTQRYVYSMQGMPHLLTLELGNTVSITHYRYSLSGIKGTVIGLQRDWTSGSVNVEVLV